jgi:hypothetical protein
MSNTKISDTCKLELITEAKKVSDYQVNFLIYKNTLDNIKNKIEKINELISEQKKKIEDKKLERENKQTNICSPTFTNTSCSNECENFYNPNKNELKVIGKAIDCYDVPIPTPTPTKENFDMLGTITDNLTLIIKDKIPRKNDISKKCECRVPKYEEIDLLNKELENLNLQKTELIKEYDLANKPPETPILNLTCCTNKITCTDGSCGSLFDDCKIKAVETNETFEANITDNNNLFSLKNMSCIILLIIIIFLIFLQRK